ncbi:MAG: hypothetical protein IIB57_14925 [Planctomycetes bacterium]|nr:hypothetical protein [Planctomycetota bacterium]
MQVPVKHDECPQYALPLAFTTKLLVVMAIIALFISILLPAMETAQWKAKWSVCVSHIRNNAACGGVYAADDPNGVVIPVHPLMFQQGGAKRYSTCRADRDRPSVKSAGSCLERQLCRQHIG